MSFPDPAAAANNADARYSQRKAWYKRKAPTTLIGVALLGIVTSIIAGLIGSGLWRPNGHDKQAVSAPSAPSSPASKAEWLDELNPVEGTPGLSGTFSANGRAIPHGVGFDVDYHRANQVIYDVAGHYATFEADFVIGDDQTPKGPAHFDVLGDGISLLSGGIDVGPTSGVVHKTLPITGVRRLALVITTTNMDFPQAMFGNARVVP